MVNFFERNILDFATEILQNMPALTILGARQVGKSTLSKKLVLNSTSSYISLDDVTSRTIAESDPTAISELCKEGTVVIDEFQRVPDLVLAVKAEIDANRRPGQYILTGSSNPATFNSTPDSLAGRTIDVVVWGLSQGELKGVKEDFVSKILSQELNIEAFHTLESKESYVEIMATGAYPELNSLGPTLKRKWIDSYVDRVTTHDVREIHRIESTTNLRKLFALLATEQATELVPNNLAKKIGSNNHTINTYIKALSATYQIKQVPAFSMNLGKQVISKPKNYVADSAVAMKLAQVTKRYLSSIPGQTHLGGFIEGFVAMEMVKQQTWSDTDYELSHYRSGKNEVDLVVNLEDGAVIGIEVKSSSTISHSDFSGLKHLKEQLGERFLKGIVLNTGQKSQRYGENLYSMPISALWEL